MIAQLKVFVFGLVQIIRSRTSFPSGLFVSESFLGSLMDARIARPRGNLHFLGVECEVYVTPTPSPSTSSLRNSVSPGQPAPILTSAGTVQSITPGVREFDNSFSLS